MSTDKMSLTERQLTKCELTKCQLTKCHWHNVSWGNTSRWNSAIDKTSIYKMLFAKMWVVKMSVEETHWRRDFNPTNFRPKWTQNCLSPISLKHFAGQKWRKQKKCFSFECKLENHVSFVDVSLDDIFSVIWSDVVLLGDISFCVFLLDDV